MRQDLPTAIFATVLFKDPLLLITETQDAIIFVASSDHVQKL